MRLSKYSWSEMRCEDLMSPDLVSEIVLVGRVALMVAVLVLIVVAALTQPAALTWSQSGRSLRVT
jgi:hypothetical protein